MSAVSATPVESVAATPVEERLRRMRTLSEQDRAAAQQEAWAWIVELGQRVGTNREEALAELAELFHAGKPSRGIEGPTEGRLVSFTVHPAIDRLLAAITSAWMPWMGKTFDTLAQGGGNLLARSAKWPMKLLWPTYRTGPAPNAIAAFDFETRVEAGKVDPDIEVLVIDYAPVASNPRLIIKSIRDELVEIVPGAHLGKMLWRSGSGKHTLLAYFALKSS